MLDLGCGGGIVTSELSERARVVGVDISFAQLWAASSRAPSAMLAQADMRSVAFGHGSFDAVAAFSSVIHLPRELHSDLCVRIGGWLRSDGLLFGTFGAGDNPRERAEFHGQPMYWSHFDAQTSRQLLRDAGFHLVEDELVPQRGEEFLWIIASR